MRKSIFPLLLCFTSLGAAAQDIGSLNWLAGCWRAEGGEPGSQEQWMAPAGGGMLGMARTIRRGKVGEFEFLQIIANAEGRLTYVAKPSGQAEASFVVKEQGEQSVTFENPAHDFPQRISYKREGLVLKARIEGMRKGQLRGIDFVMRKAACDGE